MNTTHRYIRAAAMVIVVTLALCGVSKGDVYWHLDSTVESCSMVINPSLTQEQWHTFIEQAGAIIAFKSLNSAHTLGKGNVRLAIDNGYTPVDQHNPAWINTFAHPDADCPLGDAITFPALRASVGVTDQMDIGGFWTTAPNANYGFVGGDIKYAIMSEAKRKPTMAARLSATILTGVEDFDATVYSFDIIAGKTFKRFSPYLGFRSSAIFGTETTGKVNLDNEIVPVSQAFGGATYSIWALTLSAEYNFASVNTFAMAVGFNL